MGSENDIQLNEANACRESEQFIAGIQPYPQGRFAGRGIVICGGGVKYFTNAWVCICILRQHGCQLPIQFWHLGPEEMDERMKELLRPMGVECVDAMEVAVGHPVRTLKGWELKAYAIIHCPYREVILLDSDNVALRDPEFLFSTSQYEETGAVFWPDYGRLEPHRPIWRICGIEYRDEPEFESGQIVVDKELCWKAMQLCMWYNEFSDFFYQHVHGDKETFHLAFRKLDQAYSMPSRPIHPLESTMCQHDFDGNRLFQHRNMDKWSLSHENLRIPGFLLEDDCLKHLAALRSQWNGIIESRFRYTPDGRSEAELCAAQELTSSIFRYRRIGHDERTIHFCPSGLVGLGAASCEVYWNLESQPDGLVLQIASSSEVTCRLHREADGAWRGPWLIHERMPIEISRADHEWQVSTMLPGQATRACAVNCDGWRKRLGQGVEEQLQTLGLEVQRIDLHEWISRSDAAVSEREINQCGLAAMLLARIGAPGEAGAHERIIVLLDVERISERLREWLNTFDTVVCMAERLAVWLHASGITTRLSVLSHTAGLTRNATLLNAGTKHTGVVRFGAGFSAKDGELMPEIVKAFQRAFPHERDVCLSLLAPLDQLDGDEADSRIELRKGCIGDEAWELWIKELDCMVARGPISEMEFTEWEATRQGVAVVGSSAMTLGMLPAFDLRRGNGTRTGTGLPNYEPRSDCLVNGWREIRFAVKQLQKEGRHRAQMRLHRTGEQQESFARSLAACMGIRQGTARSRNEKPTVAVCAVLGSSEMVWEPILSRLVAMQAEVRPEVLLYCTPGMLGVANGLAARMQCFARVVVGSEAMKPGEAVFAALGRAFEHCESAVMVRPELALSEHQISRLKQYLRSDEYDGAWGATFATTPDGGQTTGGRQFAWLNPAGFALRRGHWDELLNWGKVQADDFVACCVEQLRLRDRHVAVIPWSLADAAASHLDEVASAIPTSTKMNGDHVPIERLFTAPPERQEMDCLAR